MIDFKYGLFIFLVCACLVAGLFVFLADYDYKFQIAEGKKHYENYTVCSFVDIKPVAEHVTIGKPFWAVLDGTFLVMPKQDYVQLKNYLMNEKQIPIEYLVGRCDEDSENSF